MKHAALLTLLGSLFVVGCASSGQKTASVAADPPSRHHRAKAKESSFEASAGAGQMGVDNESGVYETSDIEETMSVHMDEVRVCLRKASHARGSSTGKVTLQFHVDGQGATTDVMVVATDLGNNQLEQCLVDVGRRIKFPPPLGNKATTFEYPVEFRSRRA
jgi:TonB family protein